MISFMDYHLYSGGGNGEDERGQLHRAALSRGRHLQEQKYGILKFYTPNLAYCSQSTLTPSLEP